MSLKKNVLIVVISLTLPALISCQKSNSHAQEGNISGTVTDGQTGLRLTGATVSPLTQAGKLATTDGTGDYWLPLVLAHKQTFRADLAGYLPQDLEVTVPRERTKTGVNFVLLPALYAANRIVIVLTWAATPGDLDSHLYVPDGGPYYEVSYAALGDSTLTATPFAALDVDDTDGEGPETSTIKITAGAPHFAGTYRFFVHNFSQDALFTDSAAQARVYWNGTLVQTYDVPTTGTGIYWHVFDLNGTTFTAVNTLSDTQPALPP